MANGFDLAAAKAAIAQSGYDGREIAVLGIVGESGSGKSNVARAIVALNKVTGGEIPFAGKPVTGLGGAPLEAFGRAVRMVFQGPFDSINPRISVRRSIAEPIRGHRLASRARAMDRALELAPQVLIADEVTSALDVNIQAQILRLLTRLRKERNLTVLYISHDLTVMRKFCDRAAVFRHGKRIEMRETGALFADPESAYARDLIAAAPDLDAAIAQRA